MTIDRGLQTKTDRTQSKVVIPKADNLKTFSENRLTKNVLYVFFFSHVTAHVGSKFLAMTLFPTLCTGGRVRWRHNQIFWHQVAVRWPSRDSRRSSQSEFLKIRVDLNTSLQQVLCCACYDLGSRPAKCSRSSWRFSISFQCLKLMSFRIYALAPPPFIDSRFRKTVL